MKIGLVSLCSPLHSPEVHLAQAQPFLASLRRVGELLEVGPDRLGEADLPVAFIHTGGTEQEFARLWPAWQATGKPVTLIATSASNSLPAALEILAWLQGQGARGTALLHGDPAAIAAAVTRREQVVTALEAVRRSRLGVIGDPSPWLIASQVGASSLAARWGTTLVPIPLAAVYDSMQHVMPAAAREAAAAWRALPARDGVGEEALAGAMRIFLGLADLVACHDLQALTLRCFDLLADQGHTGCLALARLNDEGVTAGCEGDVPATFTMLVLHRLTGRPAFMANPSRLDGDEAVFAHCTIPATIGASPAVRTHFESGKGAALAAGWPAETATLARFGGPALETCWLDEGTRLPHKPEESLCRTQVRLRLDHGTQYFRSRPLGNHHILVPGRHRDLVTEFLATAGLAPVA